MGTKGHADVESEHVRASLGAPLLDSEAVAASLGVTPRLIQRLVAERRIPFLKVGRFARFDPADVNVWLDQQRVEPAGARTLGSTQPGGNVANTPGGLEPCGGSYRRDSLGVRLQLVTFDSRERSSGR